MKKWLVVIFVLIGHLAFANKVYVVLSSDTSIWRNTSGGDVAYTYANEFDFDVFSNPAGVYHDVFEDSFRNGHTDSLDNPFKVTWFMHGGGWFQKGTNTDAISTLFLIKNYWEPELERWGDALEYHFHHFEWSGSAWVQATTFGETIWDFDWTMSQMIVDHALYTVCFRSGWNYMNNEYQQYLERWIPFRMEGESGMTDCTPYHPSYADYRQPGTMKGWEVRHIYMKSFTNSFANNVFNVAHGGKEQVVCIWSHQNEADYVQQIANVDAALHTAAANYPDVQFFYCSGKEAMQKWLQTADTPPPALHLFTTQSGQDVSVVIQTEADIYQEQPWVAARKYSGEYTRLDTQNVSADHWLFSYSTADTDRVVVSVCDIFGNVALAEVRDGSRRWTTQSEFYHCQPHNIDLETSAGEAILAPTPGIVINQSNSDAQTEPLRRSYWIGQTFVPPAPGISKVVFGATVYQPAEYRVELRSTLPSGFPNDNAAGLLAAANASIDVSGTTTAWLNYNGLQLDGRSYVLLFKIISGNGEIRLNTTSVYPDGMLIRAYSLDWITIPNFDCQFQIYDESQNLSIDQSSYNSDAYVSERGYFVGQSFWASFPTISGLEVNITAAQSDEKLELQLRKTLPDGSPDFAFDSMLYSTSAPIPVPGIRYVSLDWIIPPELQNQSLALVFAIPSDGKNSIRLAYDSNNPYQQGKLVVSDDLVDTQSVGNGDLYFKLFSNTYVSSGTLTTSYDAEKRVRWTSAQVNTGNMPAGTSLRARFRFADTAAALDAAPWSGYYTGSHVSLPAQSCSRMVQAQVLLESTGAATPVLKSLELFYTPPPTAASPYWVLY